MFGRFIQVEFAHISNFILDYLCVITKAWFKKIIAISLSCIRQSYSYKVS